MKKVFYLKTCSTCKRIMSAYDLSDWELREMKSKPITNEDLEMLYKITKSYEALFSKRSTEIRKRGIDVNKLSEKDFKDLILDHYSFLKRPVFVDGENIFIGNGKQNLSELDKYLAK